MLSVATSLLLLLVTEAVDPPPTLGVDRRSELSASVSGGTPAVLPGLAVGVTVEAQRRLPRRPFMVSARAQWTEASGATETWVIDHHQFVAAAAVGITGGAGAGRVWAELGGGVAGLYEALSRQELQRIQASGVPDATRSSFTLGPYAFGELGAALVLRSGFRAVFGAGPTLVRTTVAGSGLWRLGALARVGIAYDF